MNKTTALRLLAVALLGVVAVTAALAGSGGDRAGGDDGGGYASLIDLRDAAVDAGLDCPSWQLRAVDSGEGGQCSESTTLNLFEDAEAAQEGADKLSDLLGSMGVDYTILVGENWFICADDAADLKDDLGGELVTSS